MISSAVLVDSHNGERSSGGGGGSGPTVGGTPGGVTQVDLSPSIQLLLRFQRLLVSHLFPVENNVSPKHIMQGENWPNVIMEILANVG